MIKQLDELKKPYVRVFSKKFINNNIIDSYIYVNKEITLKVFINNKYFISLICSPEKLEEMVIGYLLNELIINDFSEITYLSIDYDKYEVYVILNNEMKNNISVEMQKIRGTGFCANIFSNNSKLSYNRNFDYLVSANYLLNMQKMIDNLSKIYDISGGIHYSAVCNDEDILIFVEDIGRHNTFDKLVGIACKKNIDLENKILFTSGRISSEMIRKADNFKINIICSLTAVTTESILYANEKGITLVGYLKKDSFIVYSNDSRICQI